MEKIPFMDLKAQYHSVKAEVDQAMNEVVEQVIHALTTEGPTALSGL